MLPLERLLEVAAIKSLFRGEPAGIQKGHDELVADLHAENLPLFALSGPVAFLVTGGTGSARRSSGVDARPRRLIRL
jgi:hypothetical protein